MKVKELRQRWDDPAFVESVMPTLRRIFQQREFNGPADLGGITVGLDGPVEWLQSQDFTRSSLSGLDFSYGRFSGSFAEAKLSQVRFYRAHFDRGYMRKASIHGCDFESASGSFGWDDAVVEDTSFRKTKFRGGMWEFGGRRALFRNCDFSDVRFPKVQFLASTFERCDFDGATFVGSDLRGVKFIDRMPDAEQFFDCRLESIYWNGEPV